MFSPTPVIFSVAGAAQSVPSTLQFKLGLFDILLLPGTILFNLGVGAFFTRRQTNLLMIALSPAFAAVLPRERRDLRNLTIHTLSDPKP